MTDGIDRPTLAASIGGLAGEHVVLEPLRLEHVDGLLAAATAERGAYDYTTVPGTHDEMVRYVADLVGHAEAGTAVPFAQRAVATGELVGNTRFFDFHYWRAGEFPDAVEVGGTWLAATAQRTAINTEAKLLLLSQAFERWHVERVQIATDERNERSRRAIERLGANFEGVLRHNRPSAKADEAGQLRNTAVYAVTVDEWPAVADGLRRRLGRDRTAT